MKYLLLSLCILLCTSFFGNRIPSRSELANRWIVETDRYDPSVVYLVHPKLENLKQRGDVEFFINPYTSTLRLKYVEPLGGFPECSFRKYRTCGIESNKDRKKRDSLIRVHCKDYTKESLCAYDASSGLLKIKDPDFLGGTLFQIKSGNFREIVLKIVK